MIAVKNAAVVADVKKAKSANVDVVVLAVAGAKIKSKNPLQRVFN